MSKRRRVSATFSRSVEKRCLPQVGMAGAAGELKEGAAADVTLWDLTSLALLPRTDPISLLILGSRSGDCVARERIDRQHPKHHTKRIKTYRAL